MHHEANCGIGVSFVIAPRFGIVIRAPLTDNEFDAAPKDGDADVVQASALNRPMIRNARFPGNQRLFRADKDDAGSVTLTS